MASIDIVEVDASIIVPEETQVYTPYTRETGGMVMHELTRKELSFLLQAFFPDTREREYVIDTLFYHDGFLKKTMTDVLDFIGATDELFQNTSRTRERTMRIVWTQGMDFEAPEAANDAHYEAPNPTDSKWYNYNHEVHALRLEYAESLFCQTVFLLANTDANHLWAMDPEAFPFTVEKNHRDKIELIKSICEFHRVIDPEFPELHNMIEPTVASWILVYRGFSANAHDIRESVHHQIGTLV